MFGRIPFIRYLLCLLMGILCWNFLYAQNHLTVHYWSGLFCLILVLSLMLNWLRSSWVNVSFFACIFLLGWTAAGVQSYRLNKSVSAIENKDYEAYQIVIASLPEKKGKSIRYAAEIEHLIADTSVLEVASRALFYFPSDWGDPPNVGDRLVITGALRRPDQSPSEFAFDYRQFLDRKGVPWIGFVRNERQVAKIPDSGRKSLHIRLLQFSEISDGLLRRYIRNDDAYGLVKAMILGRRDDIRNDLNAAFINSGTVHILSVSGLHIAIFFSVLHFLFSPLCRLRWGKYLYLSAISLILVGYAIITGLPPSVQRATIMCIVWMLATVFSKKQSSVNTLALSAFVILLGDPNTFFEVGFQLSFLAMLGIFLLARPVMALYQPKYRLVKHIWTLLVLSVSAQLMTFPLVTFYFNQFPTYFLFANLFIVDLAGLLIPVSFVFLLGGIAGIEWMASMAGTVLNYLAMLVNYLVEIPGNLPHALFRNLYFDLFQCLLLLSLTMIVYGAFKARRKAWVSVVALISIVYSIHASVTIIRDYRSDFVRPLGNGDAVLYKSAGRLLVFHSDTENAGLNFAAEQELTKYMARYGTDTTFIALTSGDY